MKRLGSGLTVLAGVLTATVAVGIVVVAGHTPDDPLVSVREKIATRGSVDHSPFFPDATFKTGQDVTRACLECHEESGKEMLESAHFQWVGDTITDPKTGEKTRIGKKNLLNNFCIGIAGNWDSCTRCHAGYGWEDDSFDFNNPENVDCLVCHDLSGTYLKGRAGNPRKDMDLVAAAKSVGSPKRDNCGVCHNYGGGGLGVKHGDLDSTLDNPDEYDDVHMGRYNMRCIDCHDGTKHNIKGKAYSVSVNHENGVSCTDCHNERPHQDERINGHTDKVACQTCHIPTFANNVPTKMFWDWSKAGDDSREDDVHHYLKIKGEFVYEKEVLPNYDWFNLTIDRYLAGDQIVKDGVTEMNPPRGDRKDPNAKIWPFKIHDATQPYDKKLGYLISPVTAGEGGFWHEFDWPKALQLGAKVNGLEFSGEYGFATTRMHWPLSHMVAPKEKSLTCNDCHGENGRMDWSALGYDADPITTGDTKR